MFPLPSWSLFLPSCFRLWAVLLCFPQQMLSYVSGHPGLGVISGEGHSEPEWGWPAWGFTWVIPSGHVLGGCYLRVPPYKDWTSGGSVQTPAQALILRKTPARRAWHLQDTRGLFCPLHSSVRVTGPHPASQNWKEIWSLTVPDGVSFSTIVTLAGRHLRLREAGGAPVRTHAIPAAGPVLLNTF